MSYRDRYEFYKELDDPPVIAAILALPSWVITLVTAALGVAALWVTIR